MTNVRFFKDVNGSKGFNGLCIFTDKPVEGRSRTGGKKTGWQAITAESDGAGDGPYVRHKVSSVYVNDCCTEIDEATAREMFPKLVAMAGRGR